MSGDPMSLVNPPPTCENFATDGFTFSAAANTISTWSSALPIDAIFKSLRLQILVNHIGDSVSFAINADSVIGFTQTTLAQGAYDIPIADENDDPIAVPDGVHIGMGIRLQDPATETIIDCGRIKNLLVGGLRVTLPLQTSIASTGWRIMVTKIIVNNYPLITPGIHEFTTPITTNDRALATSTVVSASYMNTSPEISKTIALSVSYTY
jgi:hypothetical protein